MSGFSIVIPTIGRDSLQRLLSRLSGAGAPIIVVDDRRDPGVALTVPPGVRVLRSGGRGPAAARNVGWRAAGTPWVVFVDDDVIPRLGWVEALAADLRAADRDGAAGSQGLIEVPRVQGRAPTDDERRTQALANARWITADMAYRRTVLVQTGGFDERFRHAFREDSDLALRITEAGHRIAEGRRRSLHPVAAADWLSGIRAQRGNFDNALMRRKHGRRWREAAGAGPGRMPAHLATFCAALLALGGPRRTASALWLVLTGDFAFRRYWRGPHTPAELARMVLSSMVIPPAAVIWRLAGEWAARNARREPPLAVLLDRDDTLIADGPYLNDPARVRPLPGVQRALRRLRDRGLLLGVVSNQSGVARGLISPQQLQAVNARVEEMLGPFHTWQICMHDESAGCQCRKPQPGMVLAAAAELGVDAGRCVVIGDTGGDVDAALAAHARAVLVPTARTLQREIHEAHTRAAVATDIEQAVSLVLKDCR